MVEKVIWSAKARDDLDNVYFSISDYSAYSEKYANDWVERLFDKLKLLEQFPEMGNIIPEKQVSFIREIFVGNYKVAYSFIHNKITILSIVPKGRNYGKL